MDSQAKATYIADQREDQLGILLRGQRAYWQLPTFLHPYLTLLQR